MSSARLLLLALSLPPALVAACELAPLDGKACPCAAGYCCTTNNTCVKKIADSDICPCPSIKLSSPVITTMGSHRSSDGAMTFGASPTEQWVSLPFSGPDQNPPTTELTPDRNGFSAVARFNPSGSGSTEFEGVVLIFQGDSCIDVSDYTGITFDLSADLRGKLLAVTVTAAGNVAHATDAKGTCTAEPSSCYGPSFALPTVASPVHVAFDQLAGGKPVDSSQLDRTRVVQVQWQVNGGADPDATFTIENAAFY